MALTDSVKSTVRSTDGAAFTGPGEFYGVTVSGAAGAVVIEDNAAVAGTNIIMNVNGMGHYFLPLPIRVKRGIAINLTGNVITTYYNDTTI